MTLLTLVISIFILLEFSNVLALYFAPGSRFANAVGVFKAWEESKQHPQIHDLLKYLVNWVAGAKLIFLLLLIVILIQADTLTQRMSVLALAVATSSFYWRLFPLIRRMDRDGQVEPRGYSRTLGIMILVFILVFAISAFI